MINYESESSKLLCENNNDDQEQELEIERVAFFWSCEILGMVICDLGLATCAWLCALHIYTCFRAVCRNNLCHMQSVDEIAKERFYI